MKQLNTLPIEQFLDKARIAINSNQRQIILDSREVKALSDCLAVVMTRLAGAIDSQMRSTQAEPPTFKINMDGGGFK
jgi:hypothetical protein